MKLLLTYQDLRKLSALYRRPGLAIQEWRRDATGRLLIDVRVDLALVSKAVGRMAKSLPITATAEHDLYLLDPEQIAIRLIDIKLDMAEIPRLLRPVLSFLNSSWMKRQLFRKIQSQPGMTVNQDKQQIIYHVNELLRQRLPQLQIDMKRINIGHEGLEAELRVR